MTAKNYAKTLNQIGEKPGKKAKFTKHNTPKKRSCGRGLKICQRCGRRGSGHIDKYGVNLCRHCFRETAQKLGFKKYN